VGLRYNRPPGWPPAPKGFVPGPNWRPDPSWPELPPGWQVWVDDGPPSAAAPPPARPATPTYPPGSPASPGGSGERDDLGAARGRGRHGSGAGDADGYRPDAGHAADPVAYPGDGAYDGGASERVRRGSHASHRGDYEQGGYPPAVSYGGPGAAADYSGDSSYSSRTYPDSSSVAPGNDLRGPGDGGYGAGPGDAGYGPGAGAGYDAASPYGSARYDDASPYGNAAYDNDSPYGSGRAEYGGPGLAGPGSAANAPHGGAGLYGGPAAPDGDMADPDMTANGPYGGMAARYGGGPYGGGAAPDQDMGSPYGGPRAPDGAATALYGGEQMAPGSVYGGGARQGRGGGPDSGQGRQDKTSGWAIASLVLGLIGGAPLSVIFGIVALVRVRKHRQKGKGLAVGGIMLSCVWIVIVAIVGTSILNQAKLGSNGQVIKGGKLSVAKLVVGDCFDNPSGGQDIATVSAIVCTQPHNAQVYGKFDLAGSDLSYPSKITQLAANGCNSHISDLSQKLVTKTMTIRFIYPEPDAWKQGDRTVNCLIVSPADVSGSLLNS
jgi:hypothetical protein